MSDNGNGHKKCYTEPTVVYVDQIPTSRMSVWMELISEVADRLEALDSGLALKYVFDNEKLGLSAFAALKKEFGNGKHRPSKIERRKVGEQLLIFIYPIDMGVSGVVIITDGDGIVAKVIAQCGGMYAAALARWIDDVQPEHLSTIADMALQSPFGCADCLVVITPTRAIHHGDADLAQRYRDTYWEPEANAAWPADKYPGFNYTGWVNLDHSIKEVQA